MSCSQLTIGYIFGIKYLGAWLYLQIVFLLKTIEMCVVYVITS